MSRFKLNNRFKLAIVLLALVVVFSIGAGLGYAFFFGGISVNLQKGLVGYWDFGAGSTTTSTPDRTPNNNDATVTGATISGITDRKGQSGKAYSFDGITNTISVPAASNLNFTSQDFSVSTWVYWTTVTSNEAFVWKGAFQARGWYIRTVGTASFDFIVNQVGTVVSQPAQASVIGAGAWYHIVATRTGATVKLYVNGVDKTSTHVDITDPIDNANDALYLGSSITAGFLEGKMDDFRVYNRTLTAAEVLALYESYNPGVVVSDLQKGLIGHWDFDAGSTTTKTPDRTPYNNDGTVTGAIIAGITDRKGQSGKAYSFDGTDDVIDMGATQTVTNGDIRSFAFWVNPSGNGVYDFILGKSNGCGNFGQYTIRSLAGGVTFNYVNDALTITAYTGTAAALGTWSHYVFTYTFGTGSSMKMYKNGALVSGSWDVNAGNLVVTNTWLGNFNLGRFGSCTGADYHFAGSIDDVRIYNRALSATEVTALYESYNPGVVVSDLQKSLVGHWKFDGVAQDSTPNNKDATVTEAILTTDRKEQASKAYDFDGTNDIIEIASTPLYSIASEMTISAWFYVDTGNAGWQRPIQKFSDLSGGNVPPFVISYGAVAQSFGCEFADSDNAEYAQYTSSSTSTSGAWYHVACVASQSGNSFDIYVNGVDKGGANWFVSGTINTTNRQITLGGARLAGTYWNGKIDDVRIYSRALSATEVKALYESYR